MYKERKITIYNKTINKKILLISDIHYTGYKDINKLKKLMKKIKTYIVDFICIPGDIIENKKLKDNNYIIDWFFELSFIAPVIISYGNHDIYNKNNNYRNKACWEKLKKIPNLYILDNSGITIDGIYFYGLTNSFDYYYKYTNESKELMSKEIKNINKISSKNYNILLCHSPLYIHDMTDEISNYDLVLSGHMHNGMIIPLIDEIFNNNIGLISPTKKLFPKYARGVVDNKNNINIISGAITKLSKNLILPIRIFNFLYPKSIDYICLEKGKNGFSVKYKYYK